FLAGKSAGRKVCEHSVFASGCYAYHIWPLCIGTQSVLGGSIVSGCEENSDVMFVSILRGEHQRVFRIVLTAADRTVGICYYADLIKILMRHCVFPAGERIKHYDHDT